MSSIPDNHNNSNTANDKKKRYKSRKVLKLESNEVKVLLEQIVKQQKANEETILTNEDAARLTNERLLQRQRERAGFLNDKEESYSSSSSSSSSYSSSDEDEDDEVEDKVQEVKTIIPHHDDKKMTKHGKNRKKSKAEKSLDEMKKSFGTPPHDIFDVTSFISGKHNDNADDTAADDVHELHIPSVWKDCLDKVPFHQVGVLLCRSGKFALSIFNFEGKVLGHNTASRYTIRKGQGKSQSAMDNTGKKPKSIGAQLRRAGEVALNLDIANIFTSLYSLLQNTQLLLIHCPNVSMYHQSIAPHLPDNNMIVKRIPLSVKRPSHQATKAVFQTLTNCILTISEKPIQKKIMTQNDTSKEQSITVEDVTTQKNKDEPEITDIEIPLTPLHEAARDGEYDTLISLLTENNDNIADVNIRAGEQLWTPLHYASEQNHTDCITALFMKGNADPSVTDIRSRPPVFLCTTESSRNAYRIARHQLGEEYASWTGVGPPTTLQQIQELKSKKKQKQKMKKQKRKKAQQQQKKEEKIENEEKQKEEEEKKATEPDLRTLHNLCDFCKTPYRKRNMYSRLEYKYCSTECVKKHQRELMATAAMARLGMKG